MVPVTASAQHLSIFYGLSKIAGVDLKNETVTVGTYPETSKAAIRTLIGAGEPLDVQVNGTSVVNNGIANIPLASSDGFGVVKAHYSYGVGIDSNTKNLIITQASESIIKAATNNYYPIVPSK